MSAAKAQTQRAQPATPLEKARNSARPQPTAAPNPVWGNLALRVQTKLTVNAPGDAAEVEADHVADSVMRMPAPGVQRKCAACAAGGAPCPDCEEEAHVQRKADTAGAAHGGEVGSDFASRLGGGAPLDAASRAFFEPRFGRDFGDVRVHAGTQADSAARSIQARAFTLGRDIAFASGEYDARSDRGRSLLAHELVHVVQQSAAPKRIQRAPLDVNDIMGDIRQGMSTPPDLYSWLHVMGERSGEVAFAADRPTGTGPDPTPVPTVQSLPVTAHFFPSWRRHTDQRALILGGFHGNERPGYETAEGLVRELQSGGGDLRFGRLAFHTMIIPHVNAGGIADHLAGVTSYNTRCNRQLVDLNRNFPGGGRRSSPVCANGGTAPDQPETEGVMNVVRQFQPHRILSLHAITDAAHAGVFADPNAPGMGSTAPDLACSMAGLLVNPRDRPHNAVRGTRCGNVVYPLDTPGRLPAEASLGRWGPSSVPGQTTPVITMEAPEFHSLGTGTGRRTVDAFLRPVRGFLIDPAELATEADRYIVRDIEAMALPQRRLFLTGRLPASDEIYGRIQGRVEGAVAALNALGPPVPVTISSRLRRMSDRVGSSSPQSEILFEKLMLHGSRSGGWDTLPDRFFRNGVRAQGVDRAAWLAEPSSSRLDIILRFSAMPGASRHHWGTEVDFNSTTNAHWEPASPPTRPVPGRFFALGQWLQANAARAGFLQTYTAGRAGGHSEEAWHYSYAPISVPLRTLFNQEVRLDQDIVAPLLTDLQARAGRAGVTLPNDLQAALAGLNLSPYVNDIGPGL